MKIIEKIETYEFEENEDVYECCGWIEEGEQIDGWQLVEKGHIVINPANGKLNVTLKFKLYEQLK